MEKNISKELGLIINEARIKAAHMRKLLDAAERLLFQEIDHVNDLFEQGEGDKSELVKIENFIDDMYRLGYSAILLQYDSFLEEDYKGLVDFKK